MRSIPAKFIALMAIFSVAAFAAAPFSAVDIWPAGELKSSAGQLSSEATAKGIAGKTIGTSTSLWRRAKSGEAELHKTKTDLLVIEEGSATLVYGGTVSSPRTSAPNEIRGVSIAGGESRRVAPGDVIRIPAGTPHQFILGKGESVAYFAMKLAR
jgi:mannose-6-phosphate isomerase-like protein (cupin superfamily)